MKFPFKFSVILLGALSIGCIFAIVFFISTKQEKAIQPISNTQLNLNGRSLRSVSQDVFKQTNATVLDLSHNSLTGSIPAEIRFLSKLEVLDLSDNAMTGLPAEIGQLRQLKILDLSNNSLTGLPLELGQLVELETLDLRGNNYSKQDLDQIRRLLSKTKILVD